MIRVKDAYGIVSTPFWYGQDTIDSLFQPAPIEQEIKLEFIDIPKVHTYT